MSSSASRYKRPFERLRQGFWQWVRRRAPRANRVKLHHKTIYVLPTWQGMGVGVVIVLLWLMGTNYENNLVLAAAFMLAALMIVSILHAFRNLSGLSLQVQAAHPSFAGDYARFDLLVGAAPRSNHENVYLHWQDAPGATVDLVGESEAVVPLLHRSQRRGWLQPQRLLVTSDFPLGFIRAWSWVYLDARALIYPAPLACDRPPLGRGGAEHGDRASRESREEFQGFANYYTGAPLSRVAWKQYARGAGLHLKDYLGYENEQVWLDWEAVPGSDTETRLSQLCYWVLQLEDGHTHYGLRLPAHTIELGAGPAHRDQVLRALALYGLSGPGGVR